MISNVVYRYNYNYYMYRYIYVEGNAAKAMEMSLYKSCANIAYIVRIKANVKQKKMYTETLYAAPHKEKLYNNYYSLTRGRAYKNSGIIIIIFISRDRD